MVGIEERPSKIRKLDTSNEVPTENQVLAELNEKHGNDPSQDESERPDEEKNDSENANEDQTPQTANLSKSALKKLRKKQEWEAGKEWRKAKRREKRTEKQARKAEARAELAVKVSLGEVTAPELDVSQVKKAFARPIQVPVTLILDCDFNELMLDKEIISMSAQLTRCYSDNKSSRYRTHLLVSSWGGTLKERFETVLASHYLSWRGVRFKETGFVEAAMEMDGIMRSNAGGKLVGALTPTDDDSDIKKSSGSKQNGELTAVEAGQTSEKGLMQTAILQSEGSPSIIDAEISSLAEEQTPPNIAEAAEKKTPNIIYLTSDSPHTLDRLSPNTSYIIGGIVDKNRHKGLCYKRACELGIATAKLPIGEYMTMQSRSVLAINHVVEIMLKWLETGDWGEAFMSVIPKRKEARLKNQDVNGKEHSEAGPRSEADGAELDDSEAQDAQA